MSIKSKHDIITLIAGGTGGHIYPALAILYEIKKTNENMNWYSTYKNIGYFWGFFLSSFVYNAGNWLTILYIVMFSWLIRFTVGLWDKNVYSIEIDPIYYIKFHFIRLIYYLKLKYLYYLKWHLYLKFLAKMN